MKREYKWLRRIALWSLCLGGAFAADAAIEGVKSELMQRDLRIMEGVLGKILSGTPRVKGMHFEGYGVVFLVEGSEDFAAPFVRVFARATEGDRDVSVEVHTREGDEDESTTSNKTLERLKEQISEFFSSYAGAIRQLKPNDRVTVRVHEGRGYAHHAKIHVPHEVELPEMPVIPDIDIDIDLDEDELGELKAQRFGLGKLRKHLAELRFKLAKSKFRMYQSAFGYGDDDEFPTLEATVRKRDIDAHQGSDGLKPRIDFKTHKTDEPVDKQIRIMSGILDSALGSRERGCFIDGGSTGFYQEGLGAVFFVSHNFGSGFASLADAYRMTYRMSSSQKDVSAKAIKALQDALTEIIADYGSTLKTVKGDEYIVVQASFAEWRHYRKTKPSGLTLKVKKSAVDQYEAGKMSLEAFRKKVEVVEL